MIFVLRLGTSFLGLSTSLHVSHSSMVVPSLLGLPTFSLCWALFCCCFQYVYSWPARTDVTRPDPNTQQIGVKYSLNWTLPWHTCTDWRNTLPWDTDWRNTLPEILTEEIDTLLRNWMNKWTLLWDIAIDWRNLFSSEILTEEIDWAIDWRNGLSRDIDWRNG